MSTTEKKIVPVSPTFARELTNHVEKSWDLASGESVANELWTSETKAFLDGWTLKSLFFSEDWVYIVVDLIASKISSQPLRVMTTVVDGENESYEPLPEHPLNALLEQPNEWQDYSSWMYNTAVELFLMGNAVMWHAPRSGQLITLPAESMTMDFDTKGRVTGYTTNELSEETGIRTVVPRASFKPDSIIHVRRPNPSSLLWGLSPFLPGRKSILFNRYSSDYLNAFYQKQATPGLALSLDRTVNEDVALRQLRSFESAYQGRKNQRRTLILPKGVSATPLTHTLADQELLEHIQLNRETICGLLKVPKHELSLQTAGSLGSEEYKVAIRNFWESTLKPGMKFIEGAMSKFFQKELGEDAFLQFDIANVEALKDDLMKKAETAAKMLAAGLSLNEVRQQVWQQEPSEAPGADVPFVLRTTGGQPGGFGQPPAPAQAPAAEPPAAPAEPEEEAKAILPVSESAKIAFTPHVEAFRARVLKQLVDEEGRTIATMAKKAVDMLVGMTSEAIDVVLGTVKRVGALSHKAPSKRALRRAIQKKLDEKFEEEWQNEVAKTLKQSVELGYDQQLEVGFNLEATRELQALRARDAEGRRLTLAARGLDSFANISEAHTERIMKQIEKGQEKGESITDIMRRVAKTLGTPGELAGRAETIARTETLTAVSIGQAAAMKNAKEVFPDLKKAWLTAGDDRVRDSHAALNGDVIPAGETFKNGLGFPRDTDASDPAEVINCRCTLLLLPPGENLEIP